MFDSYFAPFFFIFSIQMNSTNFFFLSFVLNCLDAGTSSTREWQIIWDIWGRQVERLAAYMPYMTTVKFNFCFVFSLQ
mgnify:CR=1 FL=1